MLLFAACSPGISPTPTVVGTARIATTAPTAPLASGRPRPSRPTTDTEQALLDSLPVDAGGLQLDGVQIVHETGLLIGHPVDEVLWAVGKERGDAVSVYRYGDSTTIGATKVAGIDGITLLQAFADAWNAPSVIDRGRRWVHGLPAWQLWHRGGDRTVVYVDGDVVYVVQTDDPALLEAILLEMPPVSPPA